MTRYKAAVLRAWIALLVGAAVAFAALVFSDHAAEEHSVRADAQSQGSEGAFEHELDCDSLEDDDLDDDEMGYERVTWATFDAPHDLACVAPASSVTHLRTCARRHRAPALASVFRPPNAA